jgi:thiol-disulfide isomerase/thioredoxin
MKYTFLSLLIASSLVWTAATPAESSLRPDMDLQLANVNVGDQAPELAYQNPNGDIMKLSDLRGKVVLIDFWASWCGPCRMENPNVVRIYNEYKDKRYTAGKGFEIYSVSLDQAKDRWIQAIEKDGLVWASHVSDLRGWKAQGAALYGVNSIPMTFLVDSNGKVIAKGLRGAQLEAALKSLLK